MPRPPTPTGRARRIRIGIVCHTGIEPLRQFWEFFSGMRRAHRQEYLRTCLFLGFRFGCPKKEEWPEPEPNGKIRNIRVDFFVDHPYLGQFLQRYDSRESWDKNTRWVLKTLILGHEILSGNDPGRGEKEIHPMGNKSVSSPVEKEPEDILGGLFN